MKENKSKGGNSDGKRRKKGVTDRVHPSVQSNEKVYDMKRVKRKKTLDERKQNKTISDQVDLSNVSTKVVRRKKKDEALRKKKKLSDQKIEPQEEQKHNDYMNDRIEEGTGDEDEILEQNQTEKAFGRRKKDEALRKNKKKHKVKRIKPEEEQKSDDNMEYDVGEGNVDENFKLEQKQRKTKKKKRSMRASEDNMDKTKKGRGAEIVEHLPTKGDQDLLMEKKEDEDEVYQISSEDEASSQGMIKWITNYYQSRPGLNVLQEKIDEFITAHEAQEEQARIEKEEQASEGGWTVVVHHKGRKKTTDAESGIAVGSVSQAAVLDKMATKKNKDVGLDFYRFQKREAKRNEIIMLRSKFEQDKKRMQELRAQRKFKPY